MTEQHQARTLVATLRDALQEMDAELEHMREGLDAIDAVTKLLRAFNDLEAALPDAQADIETLEAEMEDDEDA